MKRFTNVVVAVGFAIAGSTALAGQPEQMTDVQLDAVAAGSMQVSDGLISVQVGDITIQDIPVRILTNSVNGNTVQVPVAATVNAVVAVLGSARGLAQQFGRQN